MREMILELIGLFITLVAMRGGTLERFTQTRRGLRRKWWTGMDETVSRDDSGLVDKECICGCDDRKLFLVLPLDWWGTESGEIGGEKEAPCGVAFGWRVRRRVMWDSSDPWGSRWS